MKPGNARFGALTQFRRELDVAAAFAVGVEDGAARDGDVEHFLEAQRLGAELGVVVYPLAAFAELELHGNQPVVAADVRRL